MRKLMSLLACGLLASTLVACGGSSGNLTDTGDETDNGVTSSYEKIKGKWSGPVQDADRRGVIELTAESFEPGEKIGTGAQFLEDTGEQYCGSELFADSAKPPSYFLTAETKEGLPCPNSDEGRLLNFRLDHNPGDGILTWLYKFQDESFYKHLANLTREGS